MKKIEKSNADLLILKVDYLVALPCWTRFYILLQNFTKFIAYNSSIEIAAAYL